MTDPARRARSCSSSRSAKSVVFYYFQAGRHAVGLERLLLAHVRLLPPCERLAGDDRTAHPTAAASAVNRGQADWRALPGSELDELVADVVGCRTRDLLDLGPGEPARVGWCRDSSTPKPFANIGETCDRTTPGPDPGSWTR